MTHTNHETTWIISPTHTFPLSFTSSLFFPSYPVLLSFKPYPALLSCFLSPHSHFGIFPLLSICYILQAFHILEALQSVFLSLGHWIFGLCNDMGLNQLEIFLSKKKKRLEKLNQWFKKKSMHDPHTCPYVYGSGNWFTLFISSVKLQDPILKTQLRSHLLIKWKGANNSKAWSKLLSQKADP